MNYFFFFLPLFKFKKKKKTFVYKITKKLNVRREKKILFNNSNTRRKKFPNYEKEMKFFKIETDSFKKI
jgi:hypothetical protein